MSSIGLSFSMEKSRITTQLLDLPPEILHLVASKLCLHCRHEPIPVSKPSIRYVNDIWDDRDDLVALTLTSKTLQAIAQPVLFHLLLIHGRGFNTTEQFCNRLFAAVALFDDRPDLAQLVKDLDIGAFREHAPRGLSYDIPEEQRMKVKRAVINLGFPASGWDCKGLCSRNSMVETLIQLLILQANKANRISICLPRHWKFNLLTQTGPSSERLGCRRLINATCFELELEKDTDSECCNSDDGSTCRFPQIRSIAEQALIAIAPNFRTLCCTADSLSLKTMVDTRKFSKIRNMQLVFRGKRSPLSQDFFQMLPGLRNISLVSQNAHCPMPRQFEDALLPVKDTLESLNILQNYKASWPYISETHNGFEVWHPTPGCVNLYAMTTLENFKALKVLSIDNITVFPFNPRELLPLDPQRLVNFIPQSLETLLIRNVPASIRAGCTVPDFAFEALAKAVVAGQYPNLRCVLWSNKEESHIMLPPERHGLIGQPSSSWTGDTVAALLTLDRLGGLGIEETLAAKTLEEWFDRGLWKQTLPQCDEFRWEYKDEHGAFLDVDELLKDAVYQWEVRLRVTEDWGGLTKVRVFRT